MRAIAIVLGCVCLERGGVGMTGQPSALLSSWASRWCCEVSIRALGRGDGCSFSIKGTVFVYS
jgi:hypothetical protein